MNLLTASIKLRILRTESLCTGWLPNSSTIPYPPILQQNEIWESDSMSRDGHLLVQAVVVTSSSLVTIGHKPRANLISTWHGIALEKVVGSEASTRACPIRRKTGSLPVELAGNLSLSLPFPLPLPLLLHLCLHPYLSLSPQLKLAMNEEKHWPNGSLTMRKTSLSVYEFHGCQKAEMGETTCSMIPWNLLILQTWVSNSASNAFPYYVNQSGLGCPSLIVETPEWSSVVTFVSQCPAPCRKHGNCSKTKVSASHGQVLLLLKERNEWERGDKSSGCSESINHQVGMDQGQIIATTSHRFNSGASAHHGSPWFQVPGLFLPLVPPGGPEHMEGIIGTHCVFHTQGSLSGIFF